MPTPLIHADGGRLALCGKAVRRPYLVADTTLVTCPRCLHRYLVAQRDAAARYGRIGGSASTPAKVAAARANGRKGGRPLKFGHVHTCPACKVRRPCPNAVPYLACAESDYCADHTDPHTQSGIDAARL
jgi:DNA-directed RNA polymerase subunit RPC12/RpoP